MTLYLLAIFRHFVSLLSLLFLLAMSGTAASVVAKGRGGVSFLEDETVTRPRKKPSYWGFVLQ